MHTPPVKINYCPFSALKTFSVHLEFTSAQDDVTCYLLPATCYNSYRHVKYMGPSDVHAIQRYFLIICRPRQCYNTQILSSFHPTEPPPSLNTAAQGQFLRHKGILMYRTCRVQQKCDEISFLSGDM